MSRLTLIPFHTTPLPLQLHGPARDSADEQLDKAMACACESIVSILEIGEALEEAHKDEFPVVIAKIRQIMPQANTRLHRSYAWLTIATLKVSNYDNNGTRVTFPPMHSYWKQQTFV